MKTREQELSEAIREALRMINAGQVADAATVLDSGLHLAEQLPDARSVANASGTETKLRRLFGEVSHDVGAEMARELDAALARARAEALEQAAGVAHAEAEECDRLKRNAAGYGMAGVRQCWQAGQTAAEGIEGRIRALITTPAPSSIPVERVREEALKVLRSRAFKADPYEEIHAMLERLGVPLDAIAPEPLSFCEHNSGRPHQWSTAKSPRPQCIFCEVLKPF